MTALRALALDVDGTLLTTDHRITDATRRAVAAVRRSGVAVVLASARSPQGLQPIVAELELDGPVIAFGGALVWQPDARGGIAVLEEQRLEAPSAHAVRTHAVALGIEVGWYAGDRWLVDAIGPGVEEEIVATGETPEVSAEPDERPPPHKLLCMARPGDPAPLRELQAALPPDARGDFSHQHYLEVTSAGAGKARAFAAVLRRLGVPVEASAAIGDGENDIELLRFAGRGIAMAHAVPAVRAVADVVTGTNDRDGVAAAIQKLLGK
jgi:hypothetical protein